MSMYVVAFNIVIMMKTKIWIACYYILSIFVFTRGNRSLNIAVIKDYNCYLQRCGRDSDTKYVLKKRKKKKLYPLGWNWWAASAPQCRSRQLLKSLFTFAMFKLLYPRVYHNVSIQYYRIFTTIGLACLPTLPDWA